MSLVLTLPSRVIEPGETVPTPFGETHAPASETDPTIIVALDDANLANLRAALSGPVVITVDAAASQLTQAQLLTALSQRIKNGGN